MLEQEDNQPEDQLEGTAADFGIQIFLGLMIGLMGASPLVAGFSFLGDAISTQSDVDTPSPLLALIPLGLMGAGAIVIRRLFRSTDGKNRIMIRTATIAFILYPLYVAYRMTAG